MSPNTLFVLLFLILALVGAANIYILIAKKMGILDIPNDRSSHSKAVIRGGGILFYIALLLYFFYSGFSGIWFFCGITIIAVLSFMDDLKGLSVGQRLPIQALAVALILFEIYLAGAPVYILIPLLLVGVVALNCYNFIDGINGMLGMYSLVTIAFFWYLNWMVTLVPTDFFIFVIGSIIVFGYYNFRKKALFFSGDVGSMTMGLLFVYLGTLFTLKLQSPVLLLFFVVYLSDTGFTIVKRKLEGKNIFEPHREHIYERLANQKEIPHLSISMGYALVQALVNLLVLLTFRMSVELQWIILAATTLLFAGLYYDLNERLN